MAQARRLALLGFERGEEATLATLIGSLGTRVPEEWTVVPEADAEALLIDVDSMYGQMSWLRAQGGPRPIIALTASSRTEADARVSRPLDGDGLAAALAEITPKLGPARSGAAAPTPAPASPTKKPAPSAAPAPEPAPAAPAEPAAPPPPQRLVDFLRPGRLPGPVLLKDAEPKLAVDPDQRCYLGGSALKPYLPLAGQEIEAGRWEPLSAEAFAKLKGELGEQPLARLQWVAGLGASHGELLPELSAARRFKLAKYPTTEREFPKHIRIATAMLKQPATPEEIAQASGQPVEDVIDFINACAAIDLIEAELPGGGGGEAEAAKGGLLGRLRLR
ncbi:hypothetical protein [Pseudomarimonas salicorniae]|uniref:Uncharacterized protein n=1 Tax=Pseudomarimonas salicorniae TaxID=2933270 RepID=A0ABT0GHL8_9GAMM|nr:hypothetical protein [Lysobacter sp. CAU 1642]MCK7593684.1 hypothetical protein [Lysobacter sp. CAU 1642]